VEGASGCLEKGKSLLLD